MSQGMKKKPFAKKNFVLDSSAIEEDPLAQSIYTAMYFTSSRELILAEIMKASNS
jgi:hypothetical protein